MNWLDILERINQGEDDHTEFKRGLGDLKPVGRAIAAFANTDGGIVVLGVDDAQTIVGVEEDEEAVSERLTSFLHSGLSAPVQAGSDDTRTRMVGYTGLRFPVSEASNLFVAMGAYSCEGGAPVWSPRPLNCRIFTTFSATS